MRTLFKVVAAIMSAFATAISLSFNTFNILPHAPWPLIALIFFLIFASFVGWGWYNAEKHNRESKDKDAELERRLKKLELEEKELEKKRREGPTY